MTSTTHRRDAVGMIVLVLLAAIPPGARGQSTAAAAGAVDFEAYSLGSPRAAGAKSMSMLSLPFAVRVPVGSALAFSAAGAMARASVTDLAGSTTTLSGPTDTEVRATLSANREGSAVSVAAVGLLPTGHSTLTLSETLVAGAVASDLMPFRVSSWGSGGGAAVDVTAIRATEGGSVGVTATYRMAGTFKPLEALDVDYRPGPELRVRFALDRNLDRDRTFALQVAYSRFGEDKWQGIGLLHTGQRVLAAATYAGPVGSSVASGYAGVLYRSGGALGDVLLRTGVLSGIKGPPSETLVLLGTSARVPRGAALLLPGVDFRLLRRADGTGQGMLVGVGGSAELAVGEAGTRIVPSARLRLGKLLVAEGLDSGVRGVELGLGVRFGGAR